jgi:hypothetical protein
MDIRDELWLEGLRQGHAMRLRPLGSSMVPFLRAGDIVTIAPSQKCRLGDIILYRRDDGTVMHRVVMKFADRIITKGDALRQIDPGVLPQDIYGRAVAYERHGKKQALDSLGSRLLGMAFSLTVARVPGLFGLLGAMKRYWCSGRDRLSLSKFKF